MPTVDEYAFVLYLKITRDVKKFRIFNLFVRHQPEIVQLCLIGSQLLIENCTNYKCYVIKIEKLISTV